MRRKSMALTTYTRWKLTRRVQSKRWLKTVGSSHHPIKHFIIPFIVLPADQNGMMGSMMQDLAFAIPGVDEAMGFAEIMKYPILPEYH